MSIFDKEELKRLLHETQEVLNKEGTSKDTISKTTRKEYLKWLDGYTSELKETIHSNATLPSNQRDERIQRQRTNFHFFRTIYFPHYYFLPGKSDLQEHLETIYQNIVSTKEGTKHALAAPRGHGKSTDVSLVFPIWCIVNNFKHFITIFSDAIELTETLIEAIKAELSDNDNLKADFPDATGIGKVWKVGDIVTQNGIRIKGFGSGKRVRGIKHGVHRPDLVIVDDLENDENVRSRIQRDKTEAWMDEAVANLGSVDGSMDILYIGTILHRDSVLARKLKLQFWNPAIFRAIITFPHRMDLWEDYGRIYTTQGLEKATAYYYANKPIMDNGATVLWGDAVPLDKLMRKRIESPRAFTKEMQNTPDQANKVFKLETFTFYTYHPALREMEIYGYCDPAGDTEKSDFTNITIFGVDKKSNVGYVLESYNAVIGSKQITQKIAYYQNKYKCKKFGFELNGGQFHLKPFILEEAFKQGIHMPLKGVNNTDNKMERIAELELVIENGQIVFHKDNAILLQQLDDFPEGKNDDAPDGLVCVYRLSKMAKANKSSKPRTNVRNFTNKTNRGFHV